MTPALYVLSALAAAAVLCGAFFSGLVVRNYRVSSSKIKDNSYIRIVHLSDLHSTRHGKDQKKLLEKIGICMPDMIIMTGDIVDDLRDRGPAEELLSGLSGMNVPVFYAFGNHELNIPDLSSVTDMLRSYGVVILDGSALKTEINSVPVTVCGVSDPLKYGCPGYEERNTLMRESFAGIGDDGSLTILLSHRPERPEDYAALGFDLVFCGHAHGGQVRIPKILNGLYSPGQGLFPRYAGGVYEIDGEDKTTVEIVSRGLSVFFNMPRIFNPPEIVCAVISPGSSEGEP